MLEARGLRDEVTDLLQRLLRVDTTSPPGNETAAAELLSDYLERSGVQCELYAKLLGMVVQQWALLAAGYRMLRHSARRASRRVRPRARGA